MSNYYYVFIATFMHAYLYLHTYVATSKMWLKSFLKEFAFDFECTHNGSEQSSCRSILCVWLFKVSQLINYSTGSALISTTRGWGSQGIQNRHICTSTGFLKLLVYRVCIHNYVHISGYLFILKSLKKWAFTDNNIMV